MDFQKDPATMTPEQRLDALAEVLAEGILILAETGQLKELLAEGAHSSSVSRPNANDAESKTGEDNGKDR